MNNKKGQSVLGGLLIIAFVVCFLLFLVFAGNIMIDEYCKSEIINVSYSCNCSFLENIAKQEFIEYDQNDCVLNGLTGTIICKVRTNRKIYK